MGDISWKSEDREARLCFGSEEHLRVRSVKNAYTGINEKPRVFSSC